MTRWWIGYTAVAVLAVVQVVVYAGQMPDQMAGHFDVAGTPDGWFDRTTMIAAFLGSTVGVMLLIGGVARLLPRLRNSLISVPHRDYWLHPDRRAATLARLAAALHVLALCSGLLGIATFQQIIRFHLGDPGAMRPVGWLVSLYLLLVMVVTVDVLRRFARRG